MGCCSFLHPIVSGERVQGLQHSSCLLGQIKAFHPNSKDANPEMAHVSGVPRWGVGEYPLPHSCHFSWAQEQLPSQHPGHPGLACGCREGAGRCCLGALSLRFLQDGWLSFSWALPFLTSEWYNLRLQFGIREKVTLRPFYYFLKPTSLRYNLDILKSIHFNEVYSLMKLDTHIHLCNPYHNEDRQHFHLSLDPSNMERQSGSTLEPSCSVTSWLWWAQVISSSFVLVSPICETGRVLISKTLYFEC